MSTVWLSIEVSEDETKPTVGVTSGWDRSYDSRQANGASLGETRKVTEILDKVRIFAEGLR